ncbi:class I SAM-dependent methyltransferase [Nocardiopsis dassonvillei]|uniref:class I SAM-dependent methyltransferase n=1 Tax=Nocardiopsis dassonvillei TaxID=2014 RepID=UPI00200F04DF|nr:class I SAM-dependent methyltransferase [Nocardiopsis dassonvillei]MCK9870266.1 class I SAM-dependent methyltransferase [Nocardiopsis dassonvillei]
MPENTPRTDASWVSSPNPTLYSPRNLARYKRLVGELSHTYAWRIDNTALAGLYAEHVSARHLEIGPANAEMLATTPPPAPPEQWRVDVLDINTAPLAHAQQRLSGRAQVTAHLHDILAAPWPGLSRTFTSIAMGNVLHCAPGAGFTAKATAFNGLVDALTDDGVAFGYTLLGAGDPDADHNLPARLLMRAYNKPGSNTFHNRGDRLVDLERQLNLRFAQVDVQVMHSAAVFVVRGPIR